MLLGQFTCTESQLQHSIVTTRSTMTLFFNGAVVVLHTG